MKEFTVFDLEADGLLDTITKIHCLSYRIFKDNKLFHSGTITDYDTMRRFILSQKCLIGHNIIRYDIPALEKILKITISCDIIDTLGLSWYLYPTELKNGKSITRKQHGLEYWGEILGTKKPEIKDWKNLTLQEYIHRCEEDVKINTKLWLMMLEYLQRIYEDRDYDRIIKYITFKLQCAREQEEVMCDIAKDKAHQHLDVILNSIEEKTEELILAMPKNITYKTISKPKVMYKKDGSLSNHGKKWIDLCEEHQVNPEVTESLKVVKDVEEGNPNSPNQLKDWLFSLGWEPTIYNEAKSKVTGLVKEIPQISKDGKICKDIVRLTEEYPALKALEGLTILTHRKGVFEGFLNSLDSNNRIQAKVDGLTNTLRFQHRKPIANLPKVGKPWGEEIRGLITVPNSNYIMCGSDMSALEDTTKQHYMYFFDPEYVTQMRVPGFDPHIDIAVFAGLMSKEESQKFKDYKHRVEDLKEQLSEQEQQEYFILNKARGNAKTVNFAAVYGAGPPKIAKTLKCDLAFAQNLHAAYWSRNKAVKQVANMAITKTIGEQMWLYNPVSRFWYTLRFEKDKFSTLNQGTGVYCFDMWLSKVRSKSIKIMLQYHDEIGFRLLKGEEPTVEKILKNSIQEVNQIIKLNVPLGVSVAFGDSYSAIH